jgi:two-component system, cell cycle sensor histidine kinase and response regulator CckA
MDDDLAEAVGGRAGQSAVRRNSLVLSIIAIALSIGGGVAVYLLQKSGQLEYDPVLSAVVSGLAVLAILVLCALSLGRLSLGGATTSSYLFALADATGDAMVLTDAKGRAVHANTAFVRLASKAGQSRLTGMDVLYAGYPDFAEPVYQLAQAARNGSNLVRDVRVPANSSVPGASKDGPRWLRLSVSPVDGNSLWRLSDITADRQSQESAFSRLQYIITYLDNAPAGFFSTLPDGRVDYVNATLAEWLGLDLADPRNDRMPLAQLVGDDTARLLTAVEGGNNVSRTNTFAARLPNASGGFVKAEIVHRCDFDGEAHALPARSMVLRVNTDSLGQPSGDVMGLLWEAMPIGFASLSADGTLTKANARFLALSHKLKLQGKVIDAVKDVDQPAFLASLKEVRSSVEENVLCEIVLDDATPRAVQVTLRRMGKDGGIALFAVDRTESRALEVQLAQSQKMQAVGQLASGIAHDFNNVLTPIIGFADLLLTKMRPSDAAFADIMNIKQNANRAANLVRQLLAFSRKQTMQPRVNLLSESMSDLGNLLGRVLGERIGLEISHGRDLGHVLVDFNQFEQVIINLAVNARDAMPNGGTLSVKTYNLSKAESLAAPHKLPESEYVVCEVADTGTGIPKGILEKIWEPFFSTKEVGKGTGLGLSMVYGIVKQTGGFVYCDSEVGKGTTFTIYLPRHYPPAVPASAQVAEKAEPVRADFTGRGRILVVEDEDSVRAFAVRALSSRGYTVVEADSGERGLEVIEEDQHGFELILSDVVMPEMDGPTMLAEIRKRGITTKFIFMSGYAEDAFERNLENPDDFAFIQKPFTLKQLLEKVKDVMG